MTEDQTKLAAFGRIHEGIPLTHLVEELGVPYPKLLRWKTELKDAEAEGKVHELLAIDQVIVDTALDRVQSSLVSLASSDEDVAKIGEVVSGVSKGIDGLQLLNTQMQATALTLVKKISALSHNGHLEAKEVQLLTSSLSQLQTAFFNKPGTQVAIINNPQDASHPLGEFKSMLQD